MHIMLLRKYEEAIKQISSESTNHSTSIAFSCTPAKTAEVPRCYLASLRDVNDCLAPAKSETSSIRDPIIVK